MKQEALAELKKALAKKGHLLRLTGAGGDGSLDREPQTIDPDVLDELGEATREVERLTSLLRERGGSC